VIRQRAAGAVSTVIVASCPRATGEVTETNAT
jgi:hypothetical protein